MFVEAIGNLRMFQESELQVHFFAVKDVGRDGSCDTAEDL